MKTKKKYETPTTNLIQVEIEHNFCASAIVKEETKKAIKTKGHEVGQNIDGNIWKPDNWK